MNRSEIRQALEGYISEVLPIVKLIDHLFRKEKEKVVVLIKELEKFCSSKEDVYDYLDYVIEYIDNLNKFFKQQGRGVIPYTKIFLFAIKEERQSEFLMERKIKGKSTSEEAKENSEDISFFHGGNLYNLVYTAKGCLFFFSASERKMVVQLANGKICDYDSYKKICKKKKENPVGRIFIYNKIKDFKEKTEAQAAYSIYIRQERAKLARRRNKKKSSHGRH